MFLEYAYVGCFKKKSETSAISSIEDADPRFADSARDHKSRNDSLNKCFKVARLRHMSVFAIQDGGKCFAARYMINLQGLENSTDCRKGRGGKEVFDLYEIVNPIKPTMRGMCQCSYLLVMIRGRSACISVYLVFSVT